MRASGQLADAVGVEQGDHVCWAYVDNATFEEAALRFLAEGLARGDRLMWVGEGADEVLRRSGGPLADVERLTDSGALQLISVVDGYRAAGSFSPGRQLSVYDTATLRAIGDGFRGLRVVAEITGLAGDPGQRDTLLRWEHLADDYVAHGRGFTALCAYRRDALPADTVADVLSVHPVVHAEGAPVPFRVWFDDGALLVAGDVDVSSAVRFERLLQSSHVEGPVITLDVAGLGFIDLAGVRAVVRWAAALAARGTRLDVLGSSRLFRRMWELLAPTTPGISFRATLS